MKHPTKFVFAIFIFTTISGCNKYIDNDEIKLYKCKESAYYLDRNVELMNNAVSWKEPQLVKPPASKNEILQRLAIKNQLMTNAMNDNASIDLGKMRDWYNSDFCQNLLQEYQNYAYKSQNERESLIIEKNIAKDAAVHRQVQYFAKSMVDKDTKEVSCEKFKEQYEVTFRNHNTEPYREELQKGLHATISESIYKLKKIQSDYIEEKLTNENLEDIAVSIIQYCRNNTLLSNQIKESIIVQSASSKRTRALEEKVGQTSAKERCNTFTDIFCPPKIKHDAAQAAYAYSRACDNLENPVEQCPPDADTILAAKEIEILLEEKKKREIYIENPQKSRLFNGGNAFRVIASLAKDCKLQAQQEGMSSAAYEKYAAEVCTSAAQKEFVKPEADELEKINLRLSELHYSGN